MDWRDLAVRAVQVGRLQVRPEAVLSHVGLRSVDRATWQLRLDELAQLGDVCMTYKPDGREIPFIRLCEPLVVGKDVLAYLELPAPKNIIENQPPVVVVFQHPDGDGKAMVVDGYDVRQITMHAQDFIERDKVRA